MIVAVVLVALTVLVFVLVFAVGGLQRRVAALESPPVRRRRYLK